MAKTHRVKSSALDQIDATIEPMGPQPALRAEVDQLVKLNDIRALVALYDAFAAAAVKSCAARAKSPFVTLTRPECRNAWARAWRAGWNAGRSAVARSLRAAYLSRIIAIAERGDVQRVRAGRERAEVHP